MFSTETFAMGVNAPARTVSAYPFKRILRFLITLPRLWIFGLFIVLSSMLGLLSSLLFGKVTLWSSRDFYQKTKMGTLKSFVWLLPNILDPVSYNKFKVYMSKVFKYEIVDKMLIF